MANKCLVLSDDELDALLALPDDSHPALLGVMTKVQAARGASPGATIVVGSPETSHFTFTAYGQTEMEVRALLRRAWKKHCQQTNASLRWNEIGDDVTIQAVELGRAYRDGTQIA